MAKYKAALPAPVPELSWHPPPISDLVPRRSSGTPGRCPQRFPDLNISAIAPMLDLTSAHFARILYGTHRPSMETAQRLAALFGWSMDDVAKLFNGRKKKKGKETNAARRNNRKAGR